MKYGDQLYAAPRGVTWRGLSSPDPVKNRGTNKPSGGFWTSTYTGGKSHWVEWSAGELERSYNSGVVFKPGGRVLHLSTMADYEKLQTAHPRTNKFGDLMVDWESALRQYDGIHLTRAGVRALAKMSPGVYDPPLYSWDVESTVWSNPSVLEEKATVKLGSLPSASRVASRVAQNFTVPYLQALAQHAASQPEWGQGSPAATRLLKLVRSVELGNIEPFPVAELWEYLSSYDVGDEEIEVLRQVPVPRPPPQQRGVSFYEAYRAFEQETGKSVILRGVSLDDDDFAPHLVAITKAVASLPRRAAKLWQTEVKKVRLRRKGTGSEDASWRSGMVSLVVGKDNSPEAWRGFLVHELGHALEDKLGLTATAWDDSPYGQPPFVSSYAKVNASEDFAESFHSLELEPSTLKRTAPGKYQDMLGRTAEARVAKLRPGLRTVSDETFYWSSDRPVPLGFKVPIARYRDAVVEVQFELERKDTNMSYPSRLDCVFVCPTLGSGFCSGRMNKYVYRVRVSGKVFTTDGGLFTEAIIRKQRGEGEDSVLRSWAKGYWRPEDQSSLLHNMAEETLVDGTVIVEEQVKGPGMKRASTQGPHRLNCEGEFYQMDLGDDKFVHFTTSSRAAEIMASGKLLMRPPYEKFGTDTVNAVSTVWGSFVPGVQTTHTKSGEDLVGVLFKTNTVPKVAYPEEVVWDRDVTLRDAKVIPFARARSMLGSTFEGQVYYEVPRWCSGATSKQADYRRNRWRTHPRMAEALEKFGEKAVEELVYGLRVWLLDGIGGDDPEAKMVARQNKVLRSLSPPPSVPSMLYRGLSVTPKIIEEENLYPASGIESWTPVAREAESYCVGSRGVVVAVRGTALTSRGNLVLWPLDPWLLDALLLDETDEWAFEVRGDVPLAHWSLCGRSKTAGSWGYEPWSGDYPLDMNFEIVDAIDAKPAYEVLRKELKEGAGEDRRELSFVWAWVGNVYLTSQLLNGVPKDIAEKALEALRGMPEHPDFEEYRDSWSKPDQFVEALHLYQRDLAQGIEQAKKGGLVKLYKTDLDRLRTSTSRVAARYLEALDCKRKISLAWIAPNGDVHEIREDSGDGHYSWAYKYLTKADPNFTARTLEESRSTEPAGSFVLSEDGKELLREESTPWTHEEWRTRSQSDSPKLKARWSEELLVRGWLKVSNPMEAEFLGRPPYYALESMTKLHVECLLERSANVEKSKMTLWEGNKKTRLSTVDFINEYGPRGMSEKLFEFLMERESDYGALDRFRRAIRATSR